MLNERFVEGKKIEEEADRPCILLIDELDLLVTRNQSVSNKSCCKKLVIRPVFFIIWNWIAITFLYHRFCTISSTGLPNHIPS